MDPNSRPFTFSIRGLDGPDLGEHVPTLTKLVSAAEKAYPYPLTERQKSELKLAASPSFLRGDLSGGHITFIDLERVAGYIVTRTRPNGQRDKSRTENIALRESIHELDRDATSLVLMGGCPFNGGDWALLETHFPRVTRLLVETGWDECWYDAGFPASWKLETLFLSGACGEYFTAPAIRRGEIGELVLYFTSGMRFESPPPSAKVDHPCLDDSEDEDEEDEADGNEKDNGAEANEGLEKSAGVRSADGTPTLDVPALGAPTQGMEAPTQGMEAPPITIPPESATISACHDTLGIETTEVPHSQLHTLHIIENDAFDTLIRMSLALPHLAANLTNLTIRSTHNLDFTQHEETELLPVLSQLAGLKRLCISTRQKQVKDFDPIRDLLCALPDGLEELHFHGPAVRYEEGLLGEWLEDFRSGRRLKALKRLAFVCGVPVSERSFDGGDKLENAVRAAAGERGLDVVEFADGWEDVVQ